MVRALAACVGLTLTSFHVWLLAQQAWTGRLEPSAAFRWLLAFGLVAGLIALRRRGTSLLGRRAVALWVLAAVLHGPSFGAQQPAAAQLLAESSSVAIQVAGAALGLAFVLTLGRLARAGQLAIDFTVTAPWLVRVAGLRRAAFAPGFLPRPPPRA